MANKKDRKILKAIVDRMNILGIVHPFNDYNSFQLLQNKKDIIQYIQNYYIDLDWISDKFIPIDSDLRFLISILL